MAYTILVVDDEDSIRALYQAELEDEGYRVLCAPDGKTAYKCLGKEPVHLVVLDIKLRGESGLQVLRKISDAHQRIPVILSTAYGSYKEDYSSWLADGYVVKSGSMDELKAQISKSLGRRYGTAEVN